MCAQLRCTLCGQEDQQAQPVSIHQRCSLLCKVAPPLMYERTAGWLTSRHTLIWTHTHTHARSRKKTNRHIVHSYSYGHTHTHSILLLFTLLLLYIHVTHMKLRHTSMHFKRNAIFFSLQVFLSQPIQNTYTHLKYTLAVWPAWMSQYIYHCNPFWSSSHQWALTDVDDLFPDDTNIKVWFIKSLHSGTD